MIARIAGLVVMLAACSQPAPEARVGTDAPPARVFEALETRLLRAGVIGMDFHLTATGAAEIDVRGRFDMTPTGTDLRAAGTFAGQPVDLVLGRASDEIVFGRAADPLTAPVPEHLREALILGLTRMGLLHNIARLTGNAPPDHADGGVAEWVRVDGFRTDSTAARRLAFEITVAGQPAGAAELELDEDGRPRLRRQTVRFPTGDMHVIERYDQVVVEAPGS